MLDRIGLKRSFYVIEIEPRFRYFSVLVSTLNLVLNV